MIILKSVIRDVAWNSIEATWVDRTVMPDIEVPEVPAVLDAEGNELTPAVPAHIVPGEVIDTPVKCHCYSDVQMGMFRSDVTEFGGDIADLEAMIATVEAGIVPVEPPAPVVPDRIDALQGLMVLDAAGLASAYEAWALSPARTFAEKAFINKAMHWRRDDPTLLAAASSLGLSSAQVDALFISGAAL